MAEIIFGKFSDEPPDDGEYFHLILDKLEPESQTGLDQDDVEFLHEIIQTLIESKDVINLIDLHPYLVALIDGDIIDQLIPGDILEEIYRDPEVADANSRVEGDQGSNFDRIDHERMFYLKIWEAYIESLKD